MALLPDKVAEQLQHQVTTAASVRFWEYIYYLTNTLLSADTISRLVYEMMNTDNPDVLDNCRKTLEEQVSCLWTNRRCIIRIQNSDKG